MLVVENEPEELSQVVAVPLVSHRAAIYYAWSRPGETTAPLEVIENRFALCSRAGGGWFQPPRLIISLVSAPVEANMVAAKWRRRGGAPT